MSIFFLGLFMGARHAVDADHIVAVSTMTSENGNFWRSCKIGAYWGAGHTIVLLLVGLAVLGFRLTISETLARFFEACVGVMLVGLGLSVVLSLLREQLHLHPHNHAEEEEGTPHRHVHSHRDDLSHGHAHRFPVEYKSLSIGMVHGLAGSAVISLLVLSTAHSLMDGFLYLLLFGLGSIGGMIVLGALLSVPFALAPAGWVQTHRAMRALAGLASLSLGGGILYSVA
ncbi:MAG: urease accessory protein UreH [Nitrospirales bacterium]